MLIHVYGYHAYQRAITNKKTEYTKNLANKIGSIVVFAIKITVALGSISMNKNKKITGNITCLTKMILNISFIQSSFKVQLSNNPLGKSI